MTTINEARLTKRVYEADCPFTPIGTERKPCALATCDGCHIRDEYNAAEDKRLAEKFRSYCQGRDNS